MNRQEYKEAAEGLLKKAEKGVASGFSNGSTEKFTAMARVYAMLAAMPDEQGGMQDVRDTELSEMPQQAETQRPRTAEAAAMRDKAVTEALGYVLQLADPEDSDVDVGKIYGSQNREIREAVRPYLLSWVAGPLTDALLGEDLEKYSQITPATRKAHEYLRNVAS